jgi:4-hydroxy-2-oxoheptanedioate aldolase
MADLPRLNGAIRHLEEGKPTFSAFVNADVESAIAYSTAKYDSIVFEMEHNPWDVRALRDSMQYLLNRRQISQSGTLAPSVTPIVRIPPNGNEKNQWFAKQALDLGAYGVVWPHVSSVDQAYNAVAACRYPRLGDVERYEPQGIRGDGPTSALRYWGITQPEYYERADVWPLDPNGEILVILMIEDTQAIANLDEILTEVPGVGVILIGEGDLSQELGHPRQYEHPVVLEHIAQVVKTCAAHNVPVGHPHVDERNVDRVIEEGFRWLMAAPTRSYGALEKGLQIAGRS